jgi:hypothetical protein
MPTLLVDPLNVLPVENNTSATSIRKMKDVLKRQGQIEPLQVRNIHHPSLQYYRTFREDTHAADIVMAARKLGWSTILVTVMERYEY